MTGADGQAGRALQASTPPWVDLRCVTEGVLDIRDRSAVKDFVASQRPDVIVNAAAYTDVERAEEDAETAHAVNAAGAENLAIAAGKSNAKMCHISTDYVFDTKLAVPIPPEHPCDPASVYGESKRAGEIRVMEALGDDCVIIRTSWLYYQQGHNFVETMLRLMAERDEIRVIADQFGAPTWAATLAKAIWACLRVGATGLHHWRDAGIASWYDFAVAIAEIGYATGRLDRMPAVVPITTDEYPTKARRPVFSLLDTRHTERVFGLTARHWRTELSQMMGQISNA
ncbi:MAG: dTDP-4-dehydrorhamnose reductase [Synechococcaceae cyanobacterium]|nr:dTDP-4-dehydrorhamnose reductase [Synechococcaceae cyanobacterium]